MFKRLALILPGVTRRNPDPEATNDLVEMEKERRRLYRRGFAMLQEQATVKDAIRFTLQRITEWNSPSIEGLVDGIYKEWSQARRQSDQSSSL
jgi:hypothetical protein